MKRLLNLIKTDEVFQRLFFVILMIPIYILLVMYKEDIYNLFNSKTYIYKNYYIGEDIKKFKNLKDLNVTELPIVDSSLVNKKQGNLIFSFKGNELFGIFKKIDKQTYNKLLKTQPFLGSLVSCEDKKDLIVLDKKKIYKYISFCKKNKDIVVVFNKHMQTVDNDKGIFIFYH